MSENIRLSVAGMSCQGCVRSVTSIISATAGLEKEQVQVDLDEATAQFPAPEPARVQDVIARLTAQGFETQEQR